MAEQEYLTNIASIGTIDNPVSTLYVKKIFGLTCASKDESTLIFFPEDQTYKGIEFGTGNKIIIKEISEFQNNIDIGANYLNGNGGTGGLNFPGGGLNAKITGTFTTTGKINAGGNIQLNDNAISNTGGSFGIKINGSGHVSMPGNLSINNNFQCDKIITLADIDVATFVIANSYIRTNNKFNVSGVDGWTGTIDLNTDNTVLVSGGIITGKT